jgi:hypothetical protein
MPDGPQRARHPSRRHSKTSYSPVARHIRPPGNHRTTQLSSGLCIGPSSRRRSLDRLSLRSGQRFMIGDSLRSRLLPPVNGALSHPLDRRRRWGLLALGDVPKREHPLARDRNSST